MLEIVPLQPEDVAVGEALGRLTYDAYAALGRELEPDYAAELRDPARRTGEAVVLVAVDGDDVLGGVTYVEDRKSLYAEFEGEDEAGFRMLAVAPGAQGRGVGEALVRACVERAAGAGKRRLVLHTTPWMTAAHRLYARVGFRRAPELDWTPVPEVPLWGFVLELTPPP